ncbi:metal-dependent hydrolase [Macrococcus hajekii]|uniref:Metal-dependent hydrolase n=1 Tax=Macrococcus hajekii TaxID=198482 RepID=A0A4R6BI38_9STAP|nr:metal-dependent hydrolase [Macrococcus hajekii]TDM01275.1 metal-dependent hydrolase [Macrococcus hajekii]GGB10261.1 metal-dependent hydrolase [Macrococcus hajekii]
MDTATHFAMGAALAGLATVDPAVTAYYPAIATAVVAGSQIPDIDTVLKLRNNAIYITHHRGITHSIPFTLMWPLLIVGLIYLFIPTINILHFWMWTQLAVFLHVFVDIFNSYGTQALRPFSKKWIQIGIINTFDPIMFIILLTGSALWAHGENPVPVFLAIALILVIYYIIRRLLQQYIKKQALHILPHHETVLKAFVAPTIRFFEWRVAVETHSHYYIGRAFKGNVNFSDRFKRTPLPSDEIMEDARNDANLKAFISFSSIYRWTLEERDYGYELRFIDLRYLKNGHYSFVAILKLNHDYKVTHSYTGWIFSEKKLLQVLDRHPIK